VLIVSRLAEATGNTPQAVTMSMMVPAGRLNSGTGADIANRLVAGYAAFDEVAACRREVDAGNIPHAQQLVQRALQQSNANAGAWLCLAQIREAQNAPDDSVIAALRGAYERDTLATAVMRRLATKYQARNDTTALLDMLKRILAIDFRDNELMTSTAQLMVRMGQPDSAVAVVNRGLAYNPASVELLGVKAVAMAAGRHWDSAYASLQTLAEIDTSKVDSLFVYRITNYALQKPDSAAWLTWVEKATQKFPTQLNYWYTLASTRMVRGDSAGAEAAARGLLANVPPGDQSPATRQFVARGEYVVAMLLNGHGQVDSALAHAERAVALDTSITGNVAVVYLQAGARARGLSITDSTQSGAAGDSVRAAHLDRAVELLQRSVTMSAGNARLLQQASFQLGVAQFTKGVALDKQAETTRNCDIVRQLGPIWEAVNTNMAAGARTNVQIANQILTAVPQFQTRAAAFARNFHCPG
jgi:Tfp pilus assembly protein PilF